MPDLTIHSRREDRHYFKNHINKYSITTVISAKKEKRRAVRNNSENMTYSGKVCPGSKYVKGDFPY